MQMKFLTAPLGSSMRGREVCSLDPILVLSLLSLRRSGLVKVSLLMASPGSQQESINPPETIRRAAEVGAWEAFFWFVSCELSLWLRVLSFRP